MTAAVLWSRSASRAKRDRRDKVDPGRERQRTAFVPRVVTRQRKSPRKLSPADARGERNERARAGAQSMPRLHA